MNVNSSPFQPSEGTAGIPVNDEILSAPVRSALLRGSTVAFPNVKISNVTVKEETMPKITVQGGIGKDRGMQRLLKDFEMDGSG